MRKLFALGASILLLLNFSYALADANKSKPTKNPDKIAAEMDGKSNSVARVWRNKSCNQSKGVVFSFAFGARSPAAGPSGILLKLSGDQFTSL